MSDAARVDGLEIDQSLDFERRMHVVHRLAAVLGVLLFAAAIVGVFGEGPLTHASARSPNGVLSVDYDRFVRTAASTSFRLSIARRRGPVSFAISNAFLEKASINSVGPDPSSETVLPDRTVFTVQQTPPAPIVVTITPQKIGLHEVTIRTRGAQVSFKQFTYP